MFTKFYLSILLAVFAAIAGSYGYFSYSHNTRLAVYQQGALAGSLSLVQDTLSTLSSDDKEAYLNIAYRLLGATRVQERTLVRQTENNAIRPSQGDAPVPLIALSDDIVWAFSRDDGQTEYLRFPGLSEQQFRAHALLLLSRLKTMGDSPDVNQIRDFSAYYLALVDKTNLALDPQQYSDLENKRVVVVRHADQQTFSVYAPFDESRIFIVGPIRDFELFPIDSAIIMILVTSVVFICVAYWIIFVLASRIKPINTMVAAFGEGELDARIAVNGKDHFAQLSSRINQMAGRITSLLETQRGIMQAVSHELRTPLARMRFKLAFIDDEFEQQKSQTDPIRRDIDQVEGLIDEILAYHKLSQSPVLKLETVKLPDVIKQVEDNIKPVYSSVKVNTDLPEDSDVCGDGAAIERVLQNLCSNACKHASNQVTVSVFREHDNRIIVVEDDGVGVSEKDKVRIFEAFYRADSQVNQQHKGYGLGLAIVKRIVSLHQGQISVSDSSLGGAKFVLSLPIDGPDRV